MEICLHKSYVTCIHHEKNETNCYAIFYPVIHSERWECHRNKEHHFEKSVISGKVDCMVAQDNTKKQKVTFHGDVDHLWLMRQYRAIVMTIFGRQSWVIQSNCHRPARERTISILLYRVCCPGAASYIIYPRLWIPMEQFEKKNRLDGTYLDQLHKLFVESGFHIDEEWKQNICTCHMLWMYHDPCPASYHK